MTRPALAETTRRQCAQILDLLNRPGGALPAELAKVSAYWPDRIASLREGKLNGTRYRIDACTGPRRQPRYRCTGTVDDPPPVRRFKYIGAIQQANIEKAARAIRQLQNPEPSKDPATDLPWYLQ